LFDLDRLIANWEDFDSPADSPRLDEHTPHQFEILHRLLVHYESTFPLDTSTPESIDGEMIKHLEGFYDEEYYQTSFGGIAYGRDPYWLEFFESVASEISTRIGPSRVLDAGCAQGLLVEALYKLGIDAYGFDISAWAISQVLPEIRDRCRIGSITDELPGRYDLITCIEVLEHLPRSVASSAVANLCRHTDAVLFSSTWEHFEDATHLNVESQSYWSGLFAGEGFYRDFSVDATFLAPQGVLYRRAHLRDHELIGGYERTLQAVRVDLLDAHTAIRNERAERELLQQALDDPQRDFASAETIRELEELHLRRDAEAAAASDALLAYDRSQHALALELETARTELSKAQAHIDGILRTKLYRYTWPLRKTYFLKRTAKRVPEFKSAIVESTPNEPSYGLWLEMYDTMNDDRRRKLREKLSVLADPPRISILMPVYNTPLPLLREAIDSVVRQIYPHWELCIVDDHSSDPSIAEVVSEYLQLDGRIKFQRRNENGHISAASNDALDMATGTWFACLDHDDVLSEAALAYFALTIEESPDAALIYSDEDKIWIDGSRRDPFFKPDFDPVLLLGQNYLCHLSMYRVSLVDKVGRFREGYEGSQDWDLALRVSANVKRTEIVHIPRILYHWRVHPDSTAMALSAKSYAAGTGQRAVVDHLRKSDGTFDVIPLPASGWNRVRWRLPEAPPLVSIIIPTRDGELLSRCIESVKNRSTYPRYEIIVVDNGSLGYTTLDYLRDQEQFVTIIRDEAPFNYPDINNRAVARTNGEVICLLNDDTEVLGSDWLEEMVGQLLRPSVGAVGAKLYYGTGQIQHGGVILGVGGVAGHAFRTSDRLSIGDHGRLQLPQELSAVTAACMVIRREAWDQVGGMDSANLPVAFNDIDLCLRIREAGWRLVWTPFAELIHHESISRGPDTEGDRAIRFAQEIRYMKRRWGPALRTDPAYNPNLTLANELFTLAWPPRVPPD
jgi:glycosyltransferase involved in cell wall biosynthesis/2-polyprenyl-3-methyl-5-hydroxy-6-metoxy-1,4-benzoquinol methylase